MNIDKPAKVSFPHMGEYHVPIKRLIETLLPGAVVFAAPPITSYTLEIGAKHSPDYICSPFKYNMGNFIEALEAGANILVQTGMGCRYGFYGEVQEQILKDMGYAFKFLCFSRERAQPVRLYNTLKTMGSPLSPLQIAHAIFFAVRSIAIMDEFNYKMREKAGTEMIPGSCEKLSDALLTDIAAAKTRQDLSRIKAKYTKALNHIAMKPYDNFPRVGIVGELYTVMEPFANIFIEKKLSRYGMSVSRKMSVSFLLFGKNDRLSLIKSGKYLKHTIGANGVDTVAQSLAYAKRGYDGIIHIKAFGCAPELAAMPALTKISRDYNIPILNMSFDSQTGEAGVETRIEAFCDMINMKREKNNAEKAMSWGGRWLHLHKRSNT